MANTTIALRSSGTAAATPSLGVLANGELSINYADGIIYYKTAANTLGSIRTTQPAGLTTEVQFNDAGSLGSDSDFTFNKTTNTLNIANVIVSTTLTTGSGVGGILAGANVVYSNTFVANSTTTSTSTTTGAVIVAGGLGVAGNVYAGNINVASRVDWAPVNYAPPSFTTRSSGTKLNLYPALSGSTVDYAIGIDGATLWSSVPQATNSYYFKWYGGDTNIASLDGSGLFTTITANITGTTASTSNTTGALKVAGGLGVKGNVYSSNVAATGDVIAGLGDGVVLGGATNPIFAGIGNVDGYIQSYMINYANTVNASTDFAAYPANGTDTAGWIDMGITSNTYASATYSITGRNEGYVLMSAPTGSGTSGNLVFGTDATGTSNSIEFYTGGFNKSKAYANVKITTQTTSTSNVTGSLQVVGGVGVKGNVSADGIIFPDGTRQTTSASAGSVSIGDVLALSIALG